MAFGLGVTIMCNKVIPALATVKDVK